MATYLEVGDNWPYEAYEGVTSDNYVNYVGRTAIGLGYTGYGQTYGAYINPNHCLFRCNAVTLNEFMTNDLYAGTIFKTTWENVDGDTVSIEVEKIGTNQVRTTFKNETTDAVLYTNTGMLTVLNNIINGSQYRKTVYFAIMKHGYNGTVGTPITTYIDIFDAEYLNTHKNIGAGWTSLCSFNCSSTSSTALYAMFKGSGEIEDWDIGNPSEPSPPGTGLYTYTDNEIDWPDLPSLSAISSGFLSLYKLTPENLNALGEYLWSNNFFDNIIKNYSSPFENIVSLNILPLSITGQVDSVKIGNLDSSVVAQKLSGQFLDCDFGSVGIPKIFGNQLDFSPATSCSIYLPYIGFRSLDLDAASGGIISLRYRVDLVTGSCVALIRITQTDRYKHDSVEYSFTGNIASPIPISGSNYSGIVGSILGGLSRAVTSGMSGNFMGIAGGVSSIMNSKPEYSRSGNISGTAGLLGLQQAFILLNSPIQSIAGDIKHLEGLRSNVKVAFSGLSGFQKIETYTPTTGLAAECTAEELEEIKNLLMEGVYF